MTLHIVVLLVLVWSGVLGLWTQSCWRAAGLGLPEVAAATAEAGRKALRRASGAAFLISLCALGGAIALDDRGHHDAALRVLQVCGLCGFHVVFWWGGAPLHRLRRGESAAAGPSASGARSPGLRVASLVARDEDEILPGWWWAVPFGLVLIGPVAGLGAHVAGAPLTSGTWTILVIAAGACMAFALPWGAWAGAARSTPQDLAGAADAEALDRACRAFRRFLTRGIFGCVVVTCAVGAAVGIGALLSDGDAAAQGRWCAIAGGGGGALVGCAGAVVGAIADRHRRAILDMGGRPPEPGTGASRRAAVGPAATVARD